MGKKLDTYVNIRLVKVNLSTQMGLSMTLVVE
jgi:hypothetical protein